MGLHFRIGNAEELKVNCPSPMPAGVLVENFANMHMQLHMS